MKNKKIEYLLKIIFIIIIIITIFISVDLFQVKNGRTPIFCINTKTYRDGGSKEYIGIGYKIIIYNNNSNKNFQFGTLFLKYR